MLMKLLVNAFERARSKLIVTRSHNRIPSDSDIEITNPDAIPIKHKTIIQHQPRSSLSKWLCTTPISINKPISTRVRRSSSWRSLRERGNCSIHSRTHSVDELHRSKKQRKDVTETTSHIRFDRLSSTLIDYSNPTKRSPRRQQQQPVLSHYSGGADSGYSEESFALRSSQRPSHTSCPHCHCEQRSSFHRYRKLSINHSSSDSSSPSEIPKSYDNFFVNRSVMPKNLASQHKLTRTLADKRRRNLSCDGAIWTRPQSQKSSLPVFSESNHLPLQRHFTTIGMTHCQPSNTYTKTLPTHGNVFGELNLAAIELDSLRTSFSSTSFSSSSSSFAIHRRQNPRKQVFLVWNEHQNTSLLSKTNGSNLFSVRRGDQVRLLKRMGKSTLLVQKEEDGLIGFLPQTCLAHHQINSFLTLKGLRETVL